MIAEDRAVLSKVPGRHAGLLDHQDPGDDAGRDRRRQRVDDLARRNHAGGRRRPGSTAIWSARRSSAVLLLGLVSAQIAAQRFNPWLYWATIIASTTAGTTLADFATRSLGIGYTGGSALAARLRAGLAGRLVHRRSDHLGQHCPHAAGRKLLLADDHLLADAGHRARRLGGRRLAGSAISAARCCSASRSRCWRRSITATGVSRVCAVLGGLHPDPAARRDGRRFPRQAARQGRPRPQPPDRLAGARPPAIAVLILVLPQRAGGHPAAKAKPA